MTVDHGHESLKVVYLDMLDGCNTYLELHFSNDAVGEHLEVELFVLLKSQCIIDAEVGHIDVKLCLSIGRVLVGLIETFTTFLHSLFATVFPQLDGKLLAILFYVGLLVHAKLLLARLSQLLVV